MPLSMSSNKHSSCSRHHHVRRSAVSFGKTDSVGNAHGRCGSNSRANRRLPHDACILGRSRRHTVAWALPGQSSLLPECDCASGRVRARGASRRRRGGRRPALTLAGSTLNVRASPSGSASSSSSSHPKARLRLPCMVSQKFVVSPAPCQQKKKLFKPFQPSTQVDGEWGRSGEYSSSDPEGEAARAARILAFQSRRRGSSSGRTFACHIRGRPFHRRFAGQRQRPLRERGLTRALHNDNWHFCHNTRPPQRQLASLV
jgi:hypothetical protein